MAKPRTYKTEGVVIRQMPLGEADRILTLYTPRHGKVRAVARGVRRTKSKLGGHTEPLTHARLSIAYGKTLDVVSETETLHSFRRLKEDLGLLSKALYLAELVDGFSVEQAPNPQVYRLLLGTMTILDAGSGTPASSALIRHFELQLLIHSGFGPELRSCVECRDELEPGDHLYSSARGGVLCKNCRSASREALTPVSLNGMKVLRFLEHEPADAAARLDVPDEVMRETERLLGTYVRYVLEKEMKSTAFMKLVASSS